MFVDSFQKNRRHIYGKLVFQTAKLIPNLKELLVAFQDGDIKLI
jgi:hypothetical protein